MQQLQLPFITSLQIRMNLYVESFGNTLYSKVKESGVKHLHATSKRVTIILIALNLSLLR